MNFQKLLEKTEGFCSSEVGDVITGEVVSVDSGFVVVAGEYKNDIFIPRKEVDDTIAVGDTISAVLVDVSNQYGQAIGSIDGLTDRLNWEKIENAHKNKTHITVYVESERPGGVIVSFEGFSGFMPISLLDIRYSNDTSKYVGMSVDVMIVRVNSETKSYIASRKDYQKLLRRGGREEMVYQVGQKLTGVIRSIRDFGVFIDIGDIDGLLKQRSILPGTTALRMSDIFELDKKIEVIVDSVDELGRVELVPAKDILGEYQVNVGDRLNAVVIRKMEIGVLVDIASNRKIQKTALLPESKNDDYSDLKIGDSISVVADRVEDDRIFCVRG